MSEPLSPRQAALRAAALEAVAVVFTAEYEKARGEAGPVLAAMYREGNDRQAVLLPDGEKIGQLTVKAPAPEVTWTREDTLEDWAREHIGDGAFEDYAPETVLSSREVLAIIKAAKPELVATRMRPGTRKKLLAEVVKSGGFLEDKDEGTKDRVADVAEGEVTGAFAFTDQNSAHRRNRIMQELFNGGLRDVIGFGLPALPAAEGETDAG